MANTRPYCQDTAEFTRIKRYYTIPDVSNASKLFLYVSDTFNDYLIWSGKNDYDQIVPGLYLGRIPTKDGFKLPDNIGLVISTVSYQEIAGLGMTKTVYTPDDWKKQGVEHYYLNIHDMTADVSTDDLVAHAKKIKDFFDKCKADPAITKNAVYVHCKAGRSRSAMLVATYLAMFGHEPEFSIVGLPHKDVDKAVQFIKDKRPQIDVGIHKTSKAYDAVSTRYNLFGSNTDNQSSQAAHAYASLYEYLASLKSKDEIRKLTSFKELGRYATAIQGFLKSPYRTQYVRNFFNDILYSSDGKWYDRLKSKSGAIEDLLNANKGETDYGVADKNERVKLVENFTQELDEHLKKMNLLPVVERVEPK